MYIIINIPKQCFGDAKHLFERWRGEEIYIVPALASLHVIIKQ